MKQVLESVDIFLTNPRHPGLNNEKLTETRTDGLRTIRASRDVRILLLDLGGNQYVLQEAGQHDDIYRRARSLSFAVARDTRRIMQFDGDSRELLVSPPVSVAALDAGLTRILTGWTQEQLAELGLPREHATRLLSARDQTEFLSACDGLDEELFGRAVAALTVSPEGWRQANLSPEEWEREQLLAAITGFGQISGFTPFLSAEEAREVFRRPIEEWMVFLHPDQLELARTTFAGPARVRGGPGTGKTVLALHRAVALGKRYPPRDGEPRVLFTTFVKSLTDVLEELFQRIPGALPGSVDFSTADSLAFRLCPVEIRGGGVQQGKVDAAFESAWRETWAAEAALREAGLSKRYVRDEINRLIKGRGLTHEKEYLSLSRSGRLTPLKAPVRAAIWALHEFWMAVMDEQGLVDYPDMAIGALEAVSDLNEPMYSAVIVDEAQDLTLVTARFLSRLSDPAGSGSEPDALFITGDDGQRFYPGAYRLRDAKIGVQGRSRVLRVNYRNSPQILATAQAIAGYRTVAGLETDYVEERDAATRPEGARPKLVVCRDREQEMQAVADMILETVRAGHAELGDIAVAVLSNAEVYRVASALGDRQVRPTRLDRYSGASSPEVKVGTFHRLKGLEFKVVFIPFMSFDVFPPSAASEGEDADRLNDLLSVLRIAVLRARDTLVFTCTQVPSPLLEPALETLDIIELDRRADS